MIFSENEQLIDPFIELRMIEEKGMKISMIQSEIIVRKKLSVSILDDLSKETFV